jgi:hypothetical protein
LVFLPYTWNGGGGPSGNRYFLSLYPVLFFLAPRLTSPGVVVLTWLGGALFTAKLVVNPFVAAKFPYLMTEKGAVRRLPVELTMANDLPIALDISRARIPYGNDPTLLLYFLDQHAFPPEPPGMWVSGAGRADIVVRSENRLERLSFVAQSPIRTVLTASAGGTPVTVPLTPGKVVTFDLPTSADRGLHSYAYLLSLRSSEGFIPHLADPGSPDSRNLGVLVRFTGIEGQRSARRAD